MLLPIGLDETRVARLPWVSIVLSSLCVLALVATWVGHDGDALQERYAEVIGYWLERPYLEPPGDAEARFGLDGETVARLGGDAEPGLAVEVEAEQRELDERYAALIEEHDASPLRRFGLVPARGVAQVGWLTGMFMHAGLLHLLGNLLLFFLVVGPFLEDAWGRPFFLGFYLAGGVIAGLAQALPMGDSPITIVGASGAISACLGAFALRFAHRRVRILYWFFIVVRGTFFVPAWAYAIIAFALDLLSLSFDGVGGGVAYAAHVGGFAFGFAVAATLRATGLEARLTPEGVAGPGRTLAASRAAEALQHGDLSGARGAYEDALRKDPDDPEALLGLLRIAGASLDRAAAGRHLERLAARRLQAGDVAGARALLLEHGAIADPSEWRPATALRAAEAVGAADAELADRLERAAERGGGAVEAKALLRRAARARGPSPGLALELAGRAAAIPGLPDELAARARALETSLRAEVAAAPPAPDPHAPIALDAPPPLSPADAVRVVPCRLQEVRDGTLRLTTGAGRPAELAAARVAAVAAGLVAELEEGGATLRNRVLLDLLVHPREGERGRVVIRLAGHALPLAQLHPGVPPPEAFARVVEALLAASGAVAVPSAAAAAGRPLSRFRDVPAYEQGVWGRRVSA